MATKKPVSEVPPAVPDDPESRRARRELGRHAQQAVRERNKNHIAYLEATAQSMSELEQNGQTSSLMSQLSDMARQRDNIARTISSIETTFQVHQEEERVKLSPINQPPQPLSATSQCQDWLSGYKVPDAFNLDIEHVAFEVFNPGTMVMAWGFSVPDTPGSVIATEKEPLKNVPAQSSLTLARQPGMRGVIVPEPDVICECLYSIQDPRSPGAPTTSIWRSANEALSGCKMLAKSVLNMEDEMVDDIPVRVILDGWDAVEHSRNLPPLWKRLRRIDTLQFRNCPDTERLAILKFMHLLLRYQAEPTIEQCARLPTWYLSRPSQSLPHSSAIDFFVWPGVRERFIFSQHQYCSNRFWGVFARSFRILWPYEFRDCYRRNVATGKYCVSPEFENRIRDINSWTMSMDFFNHFPEMYADIPAYQELPKALTWKHNPGARPVGSSKRGWPEEMNVVFSPRKRKSSDMEVLSFTVYHDWSTGDVLGLNVPGA
ncbi:bZIP transcription factor [Colletotrichum tofieldiae]|uniref:BZIP transcription factor n=1 Tax=Colletotrichum tofieldiae TaxID=708197 RepID=A0A166PCR2_9PEZI|nr:bZIP transcription factor [Colletotrichum tofieldiae]